MSVFVCVNPWPLWFFSNSQRCAQHDPDKKVCFFAQSADCFSHRRTQKDRTQTFFKSEIRNHKFKTSRVLLKIHCGRRPLNYCFCLCESVWVRGQYVFFRLAKNAQRDPYKKVCFLIKAQIVLATDAHRKTQTRALFARIDKI